MDPVILLAQRTPIPNGVHFAVNPVGPSTLRSFAVFVLHFFELGVDYVVVTGRAALRSCTGSTRRTCGLTARSGSALLRGIRLLSNRCGSLCKRFGLLLDH